MSTPDRINVEAILDDLYASEINVEVAVMGGIDARVSRRASKHG